jgi:hypothetical protein
MYIAIGFTNSGAVTSNLTSAGTLWLKVADPTGFSAPLHCELRAGSLTSGQPLASGDRGESGWNHMALRVSPTTGTVTLNFGTVGTLATGAVFSDTASVTIPFTMATPKNLAFEGVGIIDGVVVRKQGRRQGRRRRDASRAIRRRAGAGRSESCESFVRFRRRGVGAWPYLCCTRRTSAHSMNAHQPACCARQRLSPIHREARMAVEDFAESEVGVAVAATALVLSSRVRHVLHRGTVYGLAGALVAGDALLAFGRGLTRGVRATAPQARAATEEGA